MKRNPLRTGIIVLLFIFFVLCLVWFLLPVYQFNHDIKYANNTSHTNDIDYSIAKATLENDYRTNGLQVLGGILVIAGLIFTYSNYIISRDNLLTDRYNSAIKNLGQEKIELKLVGISELETISQKYDKYYWPIMEILTAYLRDNSSVDTQPNERSPKVIHISMDIEANESTKSDVLKINTVSSDIQAILDVIVRRKPFLGSGEIKHLNLQRTNLQHTNLSGVNLSGANLSETLLSRANLSGANLSEAHLSEANLLLADFSGANLEWADLSKALLSRANLSKALLSRANLSKALLSWVDLSQADLYQADLSRVLISNSNLSKADFSEANLSMSILADSDLSGANFSGANLEKANLSGANLEGTIFEGTIFKDTILQEEKVNRH